MNVPTKVIVSRAVLALFLGLVFFTPLMFNNATAEVYEFPKMIFVYILGASLIATWLVGRLFWGGPKLILPDWEVAVLLGVTILSAIFSSHFYTSVWGYYSRFNDGLVSWLVFFGLYFVGRNFLNEKRLEMIKDLVCLASLPVSLYGIFQVFSTSRVFSTLGQANWLGAYLVFILPLVLERVFGSKDNLKRNFWLAVGVSGLVCLWFTHSLSAVAGILLAALFLSYQLRGKFGQRLLVVTPVIIACALAVFLLGSPFFKSRLSDAVLFSREPGSYNISDPGLIRAGLWRGSLKMSLSSAKNLFLGTGPETFPYQYPYFRESGLNYSSEWDFIMNKPHNYYLEILTETGLPALILYLLVMLKTLKKKNIFLAAGYLGFYVTNIFGWPTVTTSLIFWLFL